MRLVTWGVGCCLCVFLVVGVWFTDYMYTPATQDNDTIIFIPKGSGVRSIKTQLADNGLIQDDFRFLILARLTGTARRLRSGEYKIPPQQTPLQILNILASGDVLRHRITIPEGSTTRQIGHILAGGGWVDLQRFLQLANSSEFITSLGLNLDSLEGYLFPDTYLLTRGEVTEESLIKMMTSRFLQIWQEVTAKLGTDLIRHQIIIMASIVEKETASPEERPLIARVFLNRLEKKMRLQSDPTVIYGIENFTGNLTREDLEKKTPYNTYQISGLPPGPICNPGKEAITAVLHPADAPYLYFVSKNDGTHHFSTTLREHNRAVRRYQKKGPDTKTGLKKKES